MVFYPQNAICPAGLIALGTRKSYNGSRQPAVGAAEQAELKGETFML
jgi:hypothetical protein